LHPFQQQDVELDDGGQIVIKSQQIGGNRTSNFPAPEPIQQDTVQKQADAIAVSGMVIRAAGLTVRFRPGSPQDAAESRNEVSTGLRSVYRYLTEVGGLTHEEAMEEMERIEQDESARTASSGFDESLGEPQGPQSEIQELMRADAAAEAAARMPQPPAMPPGGQMQTDQVGPAMQGRPGETL